jgi:hypothetical protein
LHHEALVVARARMVDRPRHNALAGSGLAADQNARVRLRNLLDQVEDALHRGARTNDSTERAAALDLPAQVRVLSAKPFVMFAEFDRKSGVLGGRFMSLQRPLHRQLQCIGNPRLRDPAIDQRFVDGPVQRSEFGIATQEHPDREWASLPGAL